MFYSLRRAISLLLIAAFLSVTGIPMLPTPPACASGSCDADMAAAMDKNMDHMLHHNGLEQNNEHQHIKKKLRKKADTCYIECGCGCNRSIDGLPQLLAPHIATCILQNKIDLQSISPVSITALLTSYISPILLPPPRIIS
ncbi:MAG: hypothetical protein R8K21_08490 [Mariprofundales bacterium]